MSLTFGFSGGILLGTVALEMLPLAEELSSLAIAIAGFVSGYAAIYGVDLAVHRGRLAGEKSEMYQEVTRLHRRRRLRDTEVTVLAVGTSAQELLEGLAIGVGAAIDLHLAFVVATATAFDNLSGALNIGQLHREKGRRQARPGTRWRILGWTGLIGLNDILGVLVGWFLLRDADPSVLALAFAIAAGGMFYIAVTDLVPIAQERHYQQSAALATAVGFLCALVFAHFSSNHKGAAGPGQAPLASSGSWSESDGPKDTVQ